MRQADDLKPTIEELAERLRIAKRDMDRAKILYYAKEGTYDEMAEAARKMSNALYDYERAKFPQRQARRKPYQALLR